jgi:DNA invertase Pin-like site-specific DNA recombinase
MILYDESLPEAFQPINVIRAAVNHDYLGSENGKLAFGYAMSLSPTHKGAGTAIVQQVRKLDSMARAHHLHVDPKMLYIDLAAPDFSTRRLGLHRLRVAARSNLFDAEQIIVESPDRLSRMPDEAEELRQEFQRLGIHVLCHTQMPTTSMAELDVYFAREKSVSSGFLS